MDDNSKLQLEGRWDEAKGRVREAWGSLTDDDVDRSQGRWDQLVGTIKQKSGETSEAVEQKLRDLLDRLDRH